MYSDLTQKSWWTCKCPPITSTVKLWTKATVLMMCPIKVICNQTIPLLYIFLYIVIILSWDMKQNGLYEKMLFFAWSALGANKTTAPNFTVAVILTFVHAWQHVYKRLARQ